MSYYHQRPYSGVARSGYYGKPYRNYGIPYRPGIPVRPKRPYVPYVLPKKPKRKATPKQKHTSIGSSIGAFIGDKVQNVVGKLTGLGDYHVANNSLMGLDPPELVNKSKRAVVLRHREYLGDIVTSSTIGAFKLQSFLLNPGRFASFPWLSALATSFQEYSWDGMVFEFKTMSADALNSTNTALGQVIMATNYNVTSPNFSSKQEMENTEFSNSCKPSSSMMHPIECARKDSVLTHYYMTSDEGPPIGSPSQFYDHANFQIATNGFQAASVNVGELWVTYEVSLYKPIIPQVLNIATFLPTIGYQAYVPSYGNTANPVGASVGWAGLGTATFSNSSGSGSTGLQLSTAGVCGGQLLLPYVFCVPTGTLNTTQNTNFIPIPFIPTDDVGTLSATIAAATNVNTWVGRTFLITMTWSTTTSLNTANVTAPVPNIFSTNYQYINFFSAASTAKFNTPATPGSHYFCQTQAVIKVTGPGVVSINWTNANVTPMNPIGQLQTCQFIPINY